MTSVRLHRLLLAAALVVPAALCVAGLWQNRIDLLREGRAEVRRTAAVMQEHARKVFETAELAIGQVDQRIAGESPASISSPETSRFLRRLKVPIEQLNSIWVADSAGLIQAGSQPWPLSSGIADRPFYQKEKEADRGIYVSAVYKGVATNAVSFAVIRRRSTLGPGFAGTIHVALRPEYFSAFFAQAAPAFAHTALLLRSDGAVLAREPADPAGPARLDPASDLMQRIAGINGRRTAQFDAAIDGVAQDAALSQVGAYPVFVAFYAPRSVLLAPWYNNVRIYGMVAAAAALTLFLVSWLALRRARAEEDALARLRAEVVQRQNAEQQLRHAQRMDAVGQLTGGIAHDFNNLLTAILGNLEMIKRASLLPGRPEGETQERINRLVATAMKAVERGSGLTKSLLAFSRIQPLQPQPLDANACLNDFQEIVRQAVGVRVQVAFEPEPGLPCCLADPAELEAAVLNLAINARDAMPEGGALRVRTREAVLNNLALAANPEAKPGRFVAIEVADAGEGMGADIAAKAFEPFFTTKPVGQGTGLGLSQVFGFARQSGGHVTIDSKPGHGTAVTLFLPVASA